ncbi:hypothetical protein B0H14DRAFT_3462535 [Mycena olivaceomarginata]|nr:hypothetical protein B0H14DRAFT_3462535 [Mycena olivaceomarginata]
MSCYDIVCQWWINLKKRLLLLPAAVRWTLILGLVRFVIPKLHIKGHKIPCQDHYSLELVPGSAQTDGEGIERPWAHIGGVGSSTKEIGPGSREDTLNGHWGFLELAEVGERLRTKRDRTSKEYAAQLESFTLFSAEQGQHVAGWQKMNPYRMTRRGLTEADVLLEFEREESQRAASGVPSIHAVSPSSFVAAGLMSRTSNDVSESKLAPVSQSQPPSPAGSTSDVHARRNPGTGSARETSPRMSSRSNIPLFLPSGLTPAQRAGEAVAGLAAIESSLRDAQLSSSLELLRRKLHVKSRLVTYKSLQAHAQGANTRSKGIVDRNECKIRLHSEKFQMAWEAKRLLAGGDAEAVGWRKLLKEDNPGARRASPPAEDALRHEGELLPLTTDEEEERVVRGGESVRQVSWIWTGAGMMGADADLEEGLRPDTTLA